MNRPRTFAIAAEAVLPEAMADERDKRRIGPIVVFRNDARPRIRRHAEHREKLVRDGLHPESASPPRAGQRVRPRLPRRESLERAAVTLPVQPVRRRDAVFGYGVRTLVDHHQVVTLGYGSGRSST